MLVIEAILESSYAYYLGIPCISVSVIGALTYWAIYRYVHRYRNVFKDIGMPCAEVKPWTGTLGRYLENDDFFKVEEQLVQEFGPIFGMFEGRQPCIMVSDLELARQVLLKDFDSFVDRRTYSRLRSRPVDYALSAMTGQRWKHLRQHMTPAFTPSALKRMAPLIQASARHFVENLRKNAAGNEDIDIKACSGCFSMDVIASVAFGFELDSMKNPENPFVTNAKSVFGGNMSKGQFRELMSMILVFPPFLNLIVALTPKNHQFNKPFIFFQEIIEKEIERRREAKLERPDFLQMIMHLEKDPKDPRFQDQLERDEYNLPWLRSGMTRDELIGQAILFFIAGYDTTANAITLLMYSLATNPECQEKLYQEIKASLMGDKEPSMDDLAEMKYLDMCVNESLRVNCPTTRLERTCTRETNLGGYRIPEGMVMLIPINVLQHDPNLWTNPDKFDPERFANGQEALTPLSYLPFGIGNRNCIGIRLALLELKMAVVSLIREFNFTLSPNTELPLKPMPINFRCYDPPILLRASPRFN